MSSPVEPAEPSRPAAFATWLLWIGVSATNAVLFGLVQVILYRRFGHHGDGQLTVLLFAVIFLLAAPAVLQGIVLSRLAPCPSFAAWVGVRWLTGIIATVAWAKMSSPTLNADRAFDLARMVAGIPGHSWHSWMWLALALYAATIALIYDMIPIVVLGWLARRPSRPFLIASVAGACAAVLLHKLYHGLVYLQIHSLYEPFDMTYAQLPWLGLAPSFATLAAFGMIQGAIGGFGLARMFSPAAGGTSAWGGRVGAAATLRVVGLVAIVLLAAHVARFAIMHAR